MELYNIFEQCSGVTTDSRKVGAGELFFALHGANFNGNLYAIKALEAGAAYAVVDEQPEALPEEYKERVIVVEDTLLALQALAAEHRRRLQIPILGIVGSNGKTTTKELTSRVLAEKFNVYATRGNLNNQSPQTLSGPRPNNSLRSYKLIKSGDFRLSPPANFANSAILPTDKISAFFMQNFLPQKPKDSSLSCPQPHRGE